MKYYTSDRETNTIIDEFETSAEAEQAIIEYESQDKKDGIYADNFYEIIEK